VVLISGIWLIVGGALIAVPSWHLRDPEKARGLLAENRRALGGRFGSSRTNTDQWVRFMQSIATGCAVLGATLVMVGVIWLVVAGVLALLWDRARPFEASNSAPELPLGPPSSGTMCA
jgi:hypothetical protein